MTTAVADHQFKIEPVPGPNTASPNQPSFVTYVENALNGGDAVYEFFAGHFEVLQHMYDTIATGGDEVWLDGTDKDSGLPVTYVAVGQNFLSVGHQYTDTTPLQDGTGDTNTYKPVGVSYVTLTTDQGTSQLILNTIHYAGNGLGGLLTAPVLAKVAWSLIKSVARFIRGVAQRIAQRVAGGGTEDPQEAEDAVENDAGDAAADAGQTGADVGEGILADVTISTAQGVAFVVGIGIFAIVLFLQLMAKQMNTQLRFYNMTATDVTFGVCWTADGTGMQGGPAAVGQTASVTKVSKAPTPPWIVGSDTAIYYAEANFINTDELAGIGYVLNAEPSGSFPGFRVLVDIPSADPNSLYVGFTDEDCSQVWTDQVTNQMSQNQDNRNTNLTASTNSGSYTLRIATNANHGTSPSPLTGAVGYNYEHLVVLTDGSVSSS
jgi:hypothetical protein